MAENRTGAFVVSGCASGIGYAITSELLKDGHTVIGLGRNIKKLQAAAVVFPQGFVACAGDLSLAEDSANVLSFIRNFLSKSNQPLLGLVNNAGVFDRVSFCESSDALWEHQFYGNLLSAVRLTRELYKELKSSSSSAVVNMSSTLGLRPIADTAAYSAIKAAMINWTQTLALEWAKDGIRVNCVCPGLVDTPIHSFHSAAETDPARIAAHGAQPLGRLGRAEDIAKSVVFLLGAQSSWTTGSVLTVDGGISL